MSVEPDNKARLEQSARRNPGWLDQVDREPDAATLARLREGAIRPTTQPAAAPALPKTVRFVWPNPARAVVILLVGGLPILGGILWLILRWLDKWAVPDWLLIGATLLAAACLLTVCRKLGAGLPIIGSASATARPNGLDLYLSHGRQASPTYLWRNTSPPLKSLRRYRLGWGEIERVALYTAAPPPPLDRRRRLTTVYAVKVWDASGRGYIALLTTDGSKARELALLIVAQAGLAPWCRLDGGGVYLHDVAVQPFDSRAWAIWRADQRRLGGVVRAELWRAEQRRIMQPDRLRPLRTAVVSVGVVAVLLFGLSLTGTTSPGPKVQMRELWMLPAFYPGYSNASSLQIAGGKLLADYDGSARWFDVSTNDAPSKYGAGDFGPPNTEVVISRNGTQAYYTVPRSPAEYDRGDTALELRSLDLKTGQVRWRQYGGQESKYVVDQSGSILHTFRYKAADGYHVVLESLDPVSGQPFWHKDLYTRAVNLDQYYLRLTANERMVFLHYDAGFTGLPADELYAFDLRDGRYQWSATYDTCCDLYADNQRVYAGSKAVLDADTGKNDSFGYPAGLNYLDNVLTADDSVYVNGTLRSNAYASATFALGANGKLLWQHEWSGNLKAVAVSGGLLYAVISQRNWLYNLEARVVALDVTTGREMWRSPAYRPQSNVDHLALVADDNRLYFMVAGEVHAFEVER